MQGENEDSRKSCHFPDTHPVSDKVRISVLALPASLSGRSATFCQTQGQGIAFNVLARNQDDHTRNIAFLMDRQGTRTQAPGFDVVWAYNSEGTWTNRHQMTVNGKRDGFERSDVLAVGEQFGIKRAADVLREVAEAVARWPAFAKEAAVDGALMSRIGKTHRTKLVKP